MKAEIVQGDLLDQEVDAIVNSWNRNIIPWWLLVPQGIAGAIKRRAGLEPFRQIGRHGPIPLGEAVLTSAGRLPFRGIIHVAGISGLWQASEYSIRHSVRSAVALAEQQGFKSLAFPIIGAGTGSFSQSKALSLMLDELQESNYVRRIRTIFSNIGYCSLPCVVLHQYRHIILRSRQWIRGRILLHFLSDVYCRIDHCRANAGQ
jgi:O-acetyl-ADP-ribose deacetylase (regulator of RNase III)